MSTYHTSTGVAPVDDPTAGYPTVTPADHARSTPGQRRMLAAAVAAGVIAAMSALILTMYVLAHTDPGAGARGLVLAVGTAMLAMAGMVLIVGVAVRPVLDELAEARRTKRAPQVLAEVAALRADLHQLAAAVAVCSGRMADLPGDVSGEVRRVAEQIQPLAERVTALEERVTAFASTDPANGANDQYLAGYADGLAGRTVGVTPINGYANGHQHGK